MTVGQETKDVLVKFYPKVADENKQAVTSMILSTICADEKTVHEAWENVSSPCGHLVRSFKQQWNKLNAIQFDIQPDNII